MKDTVANKIASFVATLVVADKPEFTAVWQSQQPLAFGLNLTAVRPMVAALQSKGAQQSTDIRGSAAQLNVLRKNFEAHLHLLARATYQCFIAANNLTDAAKVDFTPTRLRDARGIALAGMGETVLDLAEPLLTGTPAPAANHFTQVQLDAVDQFWQQFSVAVGAPTGARSKRKGLTKELPNDVRACEAKFATCDDYLPQFAIASDIGRQFSDAWFAARHVVDLGKHASKPAAPAGGNGTGGSGTSGSGTH